MTMIWHPAHGLLTTRGTPPPGWAAIPDPPQPDTIWDGAEWVPRPLALDDYSRAVQTHIDAAARSRRYDSGVSLASYVGDPDPVWAAEAAAFVAWRSAVWAQVYALWAEPPDPLPTPAEVVAALPAIAWP